MKKYTLLFTFLFLIFLSCPAFAKYSGGTGEPNTPYLISTPEDMNAIGANPHDGDKHFLMTADINMAGFTYTTALIAPDTSSSFGGFQGIPFTGVFDGAGFKVINLTIDTIYPWTSNDYLGLFGYISSTGTVKNLAIEDVSITGGNDSRYLGGLCGSNDGAISDCSSTGQVTGWSNDDLGGLVGENKGTISNCFSTVQVAGRSSLGGLAGYNYGTISNCFSTGSVTGRASLGGLVGGNRGTISNCYAASSVTGGDNSLWLGGLVGKNYGTISNCFSTGQVTWGDFSQWLGGLAGDNDGGTISNCFWDVNTSGLTHSSGGIGLTTEQMQDTFYYSINGWAGNTNWTMIQGQYPRLAWENAGGEYIPEPVIELTGSGTQQDPYQIQTVDDLQVMGLGSVLWDKHYILTADLDLTAVSLNRIGYDLSNSFKGVFDGNSYVICNLSLNLPYPAGVGLFCYIGSGGQLKHLGIEDVNISGSNNVGGLVGFNRGTINDCFSTGQVTGGNNSRYLGGLVGRNYGTISDCFSTAQVTGGNNSRYLGGLAGYNSGTSTISGCFSTGHVTGGNYSENIGGLCGYNDGEISGCYATVNITGGDNSENIGGLCGYNEGEISSCYATVNITGGADCWYLGGLCGYNYYGIISNGYATGNVTGDGESGTLGGLVGKNDDSTVSDCYALCSVTGGNGSSHLGGLCGYNYESTISDCYAIGSVSGGNNSSKLGGLCGKNREGTISKCYATGIVSGGNNSYFLGGLAGEGFRGTILDCYATGNVTAGDNSSILGGLCGQDGTTSNCYATGNVTAGNNSSKLGGLCGSSTDSTTFNCYATGSVTGGKYSKKLGGLKGSNGSGISDSSILYCYATGQVKGGVGSYDLGGLTGYNLGSVSNCYATGDVEGNSNVGGLCGENDFYYGPYGIISNCYATGAVTGDDSLGGLVGRNYRSIISNCFWDTQTSGMADGVGYNDGGTITNLQGKTTANMQIMSTFTDAGWDFTTPVWKICDGFDYPRLAWERYAGGSGTAEDPFLIRTPCQMNEIGTEPNDWDKHFLLTADINMAGFTYTTALIAPDTDSSTEDFQGIEFTGVFDGAGFRIINFTIDTAGTDNDYLGLFGFTDSTGTINNLAIEDVNITGGDSSQCLGGLAGVNIGTISNCFSTGSVTGRINLGGLVGVNIGTISNCYATGSVAGGDSSYHLGGLVGLNDGIISHCYATGPVTSGYGSWCLGGLCGYSYHGTISDCFSTGSVTSGDYSDYLGGLAGYNDTGTISDCFWDVNTSGLDTSAGGIGKTTEQMQTKSTFTDAGWDFVGETDNGTADIWRLCSDGVEYPKLAWQFLLGDFICPDGVDLLDLGVLTDNWLLPVLAGDLEKDGFVDLYDFAIFANAWQSDSESPNWNPACDIAPDGGDGFVGIDDLLVFMTGWLQESATDGDIAPVPADKFINFLDFTVFAENWLMSLE
jgi:hypothetical protein